MTTVETILAFIVAAAGFVILAACAMAGYVDNQDEE